MKNILRNILIVFIFISAINIIGDDSKKIEEVKHKENSKLIKMKSLGFMTLEKHKADRNVLDFSGMVYSSFHHKVYAFGGGHATQKFPNSVHEFDFSTLKWTQVTPDVPPSAYIAENSVKTKDGQILGGVKWQGKIWAGSRHTYDGLVALTDGRIVSVQAQEFRGASIKNYSENYKGGSGLWIFDPSKKEWSVSKKTGLAIPYSLSAFDPNQPEIIFMGRSTHMHNKCFFKLNWKTETVSLLSSAPATQNDTNLVFFPDRKSIFLFIDEKGKRKSNVYEYSIKDNKWKTLNPKGTPPKLYSLGVVYDSKHKVLSAFYDGIFHYYSPVTNQWYAQKEKHEMGRLFHHIIYNPIDNVYLMCGGKWNSYIYKFSDKPGEFEGTSK
ncbi:MAG: hypothetical protein COA79_17725 [Planctomycetota bacterium]|nr:MAG: hypothetical protein COA79_17725 [Planctomycetota bacterium]